MEFAGNHGVRVQILEAFYPALRFQSFHIVNLRARQHVGFFVVWSIFLIRDNLRNRFFDRVSLIRYILVLVALIRVLVPANHPFVSSRVVDVVVARRFHEHRHHLHRLHAHRWYDVASLMKLSLVGLIDGHHTVLCTFARRLLILHRLRHLLLIVHRTLSERREWNICINAVKISLLVVEHFYLVCWMLVFFYIRV